MTNTRINIKKSSVMTREHNIQPISIARCSQHLGAKLPTPTATCTNQDLTSYSLRRKMIVRPPGLFVSQNDCLVYLPSQKCEAQSQIVSCQTYIIKKSFNTMTSGGISEQLLFFYFKSHTYNYLISGQWTLTSQSQEHGQSFWDRESTNFDKVESDQ